MVVTLSSLRKRSRTEAYGQRPRRPNAKKIRRTRLDHFPLMRLPTEIRLQILRKLLWQKETLMKDSFERQASGSAAICKPEQNFSFCPAVLRVCRQLCEEGEPILYDNMFGCLLFWEEDWTGRTDTYIRFERRIAFAQPGYSSALLEDADILLRSPLPGYLDDYDFTRLYWKKIRKIHVTVHVTEDGSLFELRRSFRDFVKRSPDLKQLSHLTVDMQFADHTAATGSPSSFLHRGNAEITTSEQQFKDLAVGPLTLMRGLESIELRGVSHDVAADLATATTQEKLSAANLPFMFDAILEHLIKYMADETHCHLCGRAYVLARAADQAVDMNDLVLFNNAREAILSCIEKHQNSEHRDVFKHDLSPPKCCRRGHTRWHESDDEETRIIAMINTKERLERESPTLEILHKMWAWEYGGMGYFDWT